ncbi:MAG: BsuPI-related putative proteinase inhibitor [Bacillota bacterium]
MKSKFKKLIILFFMVAFLFPILVGPVAAAPLAHDPLNYFVYYMEDSNQFYFLVTNPSSQTVKLNFATEKEFDLVVQRGNQVVWRYSDNKKFNNSFKQENFLPGHAKFYKVDVPKLTSGNYTVNAYFTGGPSGGRIVAQTQINRGNQNSWKPPVTEAQGLSYRLFEGSNQDLVFVVENNSKKNIKLSFPSEQEFEIVVYNSSWNKVWQDSWNKWYSQKGKSEVLAPGQAKIYTTKLPKLANDSYYAYAYFMGSNRQDAVTSLNFNTYPGGNWNNGNWNGSPNWELANKLSFAAWFNGGKQPQIAFEVKNKTQQPVKIAYPVSKGIEVIVKGDNGFTWRYGNNLGALSTTEIAAGGASYSFVYLPDLPKGNYKAEIYYHAYSSVTPASVTSFRI